ncbi:hypothetical protein F5X97DRAFT_251934 [Nemania serpens]|nr:hypothetical protein F5X97DRAFT_251934 [Nemania serpens]
MRGCYVLFFYTSVWIYAMIYTDKAPYDIYVRLGPMHAWHGASISSILSIHTSIHPFIHNSPSISFLFHLLIQSFNRSILSLTLFTAAFSRHAT